MDANGDGGGLGSALPRPRFITPGRSRRSAFAAKGRSSSFGGGSGLFSGSPDRSRVSNAQPTRSHRLPLSAAALERASNAIGLATALGHLPPSVDPHRGGTARAVYRTAELLYSRHALGLRWSKGALVVAKAAAAANAAEMATASASAAAAVAAAKRKKRAKSGKGSGGGSGRGGDDGSSTGASSAAAASLAAAPAAAAAADGSGRLSPRHIGQNGELEEFEKVGAVDGKSELPVPIPSRSADDDDDGEEEEELLPRSAKVAAAASKKKIEIRAVATPRPLPPPPLSSSSADVDIAPATVQTMTRKVHPSPKPPPRGHAGRKKKEAGGGRVREGRSSRKGAADATGGGGGAVEEEEEVDDMAAADVSVAWTWGGGGESKGGKNAGKTPLPSDLRQLSRYACILCMYQVCTLSETNDRVLVFFKACLYFSELLSSGAVISII